MVSTKDRFISRSSGIHGEKVAATRPNTLVIWDSIKKAKCFSTVLVPNSARTNGHAHGAASGLIDQHLSATQMTATATRPNQHSIHWSFGTPSKSDCRHYRIQTISSSLWFQYPDFQSGPDHWKANDWPISLHSWLTNTCRQGKWPPQISILLLLSALSG